jgi:hypothetical protein
MIPVKDLAPLLLFIQEESLAKANSKLLLCLIMVRPNRSVAVEETPFQNM